MPELPEVETVKRGLESIVPAGSKILNIHALSPKLRTTLDKKAFLRVKGDIVIAYDRRAKYLLIHLKKYSLISHLGMTGTWRLEKKYSDLNHRLHDHIQISTNKGELIYNDPRRFGIFEVVARTDFPSSKWLTHLGPEPFAIHGLSGEYLHNKSLGRKTAVKTFIMDQKVVVGVGNIYASEALFLAGINPTKEAGKLSLKKYSELAKNIEKIIKKAIRAGGTTLKDFRQAGGSEGYFQNKLLVYGKAQQPCPKCGTKIKSKIIGGRNSFWCSSCQR